MNNFVAAHIRGIHFNFLQQLTRTLAVFAVVFASVPEVVAEEVAIPAGSGSTAMTLGEVVVTANGGPLAASQVFTSVNILPAERIENQVVANNWQLFSQVPGVMLTQFGQGTTSGKLSMRGFNGEGEINAVKLLIDGVPSNSNDGNMPYIDLAPKLDIQAIEVVKGTNDPRYGLHNIAGNANIVTKMGGNYNQGRATFGSFGTYDLQAASGIEKDGVSQNYALSYMTTNGYRSHADADNLGFSGKWFVTSESGKSRVGLIARHQKSKAKEPGYLTKDQVAQDANQSLSHNASDEDTRRMTQLAVQAEHEYSDKLFVSSQVYFNDLYDLRFVRFSAGASQQERFVAENQLGASVNATWRQGATAIGEITVMGGVDTEYQDNNSDRYNTVNQVRIAQTRKQQFDFNTQGGFIQAQVKPTDKLTITPALRVDQITGSYKNQLTGNIYDINNYGLINQPKISAIYAFNNAFSLYGNWGRSFQVGVGTASYKINQTADLGPSINDGWETGLKFRPQDWIDGRVAAWQQVASNEARRKLNDPANDSENIGKTLRQGVDLELNARPNSNIGLWFATSVQTSKILQADASALSTEGKEIDHVPNLVYNMGTDYHFSDALNLSAWINGQGSYYLERNNNTGQFGEFMLLNVSAAYKYTKAVNLELQVRNLTNRYYEYVWYDGTQSLHSPGTPLSIYGSVNVRF